MRDADLDAEVSNDRARIGMLKKLVTVLLLLIFVAAIGWGIFIHLSYAHQMPSAPEPESGRTHEISVNHGYRVYVTNDELHLAQFVFNQVFWTGMAAFAGLAAVKVYWK